MKLVRPPSRELSFWGVVRGIVVYVVLAVTITALVYLLARYYIAPHFA